MVVKVNIMEKVNQEKEKKRAYRIRDEIDTQP
jgi:hypothetical protein